MANTIDLSKLLNKFNIKITDAKEFIDAFTHISFINESNMSRESSYDRLEFLGDSIIGNFTANYIYKTFPKFNSGNMSLLRSNIVDEKSLSEIAKNLSFQEYTNLGKGEKKNNMPSSMFADIFEAFIGAVYIVEGNEKVKEILTNYLVPLIDKFDFDDLKDFKTKLQEHLQSQNRNDIKYDTINVSQQSSKPYFESKVKHNNIVLATGSGTSKKMAEKEAAKNAYKKKTD
jgi:ribonuclease-3